MPDEGVTQVGSIVGILRIDDSDWNAVLDRADAKSKQVGRNSPTVKVQTEGVPQAVAALQALKAQEDRVAQGADSMNKSVKDANDKAFRPLLTTALLLGPALGPLAITGSAVLGGLALGAAAAALGIKGLAAEAQAGTIIGNSYSTGIISLQNDLAELERQGANGILVPFNNAIAQANGLMPTLSGEVREFAGVTGDAADHLIHGLVAGFVTLRPLLTDVINDVDRGAATFDNWTSSTGGITKFMATAEYELPIIGKDVGAIVVAVLKLADAFGSTGIFALNTLGLLAKGIDAIPVSELDHVASSVAIMFAAWKGYQVLNFAKDGFDKVSGSVGTLLTYLQRSELATKAAADADAALAAKAAAASAAQDAQAASATAAALKEAGFGAAAEATTAKLGLEAIALDAEAAASRAAAVAAESQAAANEAAGLSASALLGPLGLAAAGIGAVALAFLSGSDSSRQATQDINDYTQALKADNGAIAEHTRAQAADKLVNSGAIDLAKKLGISTNDVTDALLSGGPAAADLKAKLEGLVTAGTHYVTSGKNVSGGMTEQASAAKDLLNILNQQTGDLATAVSRVNETKETYAALGIALDGSAVAATGATANYEQLHAAQLAAEGSAETMAANTAQATLEMQYENNAAGLLGQAFDLLNNKTLDVATAQTQLDSASLQAINTLKANKGSLDEHTQAGIDDRSAIEGVVKAMQNRASAEATATNDTKGATKEYQDNSAALLDQIGKLDGTKSAAYAYAQQLLAIPPVIETKAELDADKANADLAALNAKLATFSKGELGSYTFISNGGSAKPLKNADGGYISGAGSGKSDSILSWVSNGEFVEPADMTAKYRPVLEAIRNGTYGVPGPSSSSPVGQYVQAAYTSASGGSGGGTVVNQKIYPSANMDEYALGIYAGRVFQSLVG